MTTKTISPNHRRLLHEALAAALAARATGERAEVCAKIASAHRAAWASRLDPTCYRCRRVTLDGSTVWVADGPCGCHYEFTRHADGSTNCLSDSGETYRIDGVGSTWFCGCEAYGNSEDQWCKHLAGWAAVRTAARTHTAPAPVVSDRERQMREELREMGYAA